MGDFVYGLVAYIRALSYLGKRSYGKYFVYSGLIGLILFALCFYIVVWLVPLLSGWFGDIIPWDINFDFALGDIVLYILSSVLFISVFKYLMLIFTAPLMSTLSEKVEQDITGIVSHRPIIIHIIPDLLRGLRINARNIVRELGLSLMILVIGWIPVIGVVSAVMLYVVQSYYAGFGNHDFWAERHFSFKETLRFMSRHKGMMIANGLPYIILISIPFLGAFIGPPLATIAATIEGCRKLEEERI